MEIIKLRQEIQKKQIKLLEEYFNFIKELNTFELKLNGQISITDLMLNEILKRTNNLQEDQIIEEQQYLYERVVLKKYSQSVLANNKLFQNIFMINNIEEIQKRINRFLDSSSQINELEERINYIFDYIENGDENGTEQTI